MRISDWSSDVCSSDLSELACFASAAHVLAQELGGAAPEIRLANLLQLKHPYSVDLYVEKVVAHAKFVCVVLLGGKSYWPYGIEEIANIARERGKIGRAHV